MIRKIISVFFFLLFFYSCAQEFPCGNYTITTKVEEMETENTINMKFDFHFNKSSATLKVDTINSLEAYCEGQYLLKEKKNKILFFKYVGEGICSNEISINTFAIKKIKEFYYIKSGRFSTDKWFKLEKIR